MDEPTNDLDVETLEALEARLAEYDGTLIVVSHDREFLDNVVTSILVFEADGQLREYVGGYSDWARRGHHLAELDDPTGAGGQGEAGKARPAKRQTKLSYKDQRELDRVARSHRNTGGACRGAAGPGQRAGLLCQRARAHPGRTHRDRQCGSRAGSGGGALGKTGGKRGKVWHDPVSANRVPAPSAWRASRRAPGSDHWRFQTLRCAPRD